MTQEAPGDGRIPETRQGMFCDRCGNYSIRRISQIDSIGEFCCETCKRSETRRILPLFIVTGASGSGKTSVVQSLQELLPDYGVLDKDLMWSTNWDMVYNNFFRIASALAQGGTATVVVGAIIPEHLDELSDRSLVGPIRYANLHCDPETRRPRLLNRSTWQNPTDEYIRAHQDFAQWLLDHAATDFDPPMPTFDTSTDTPADVALRVAEWVKESLRSA